jgi:hypothetical protein
METTYVKSSPAKSAVLAIVIFPIMALMIGSFIYMTYDLLTVGWGPAGSPPEAPIWAWPAALAWGALGVAVFYQWCKFFVWQMFDSTPRLTLDSEGFTDKMLGVGRIDWDDITDVVLVMQGFNRTIVLHVTDRDRYVERKGALGATLYKAWHLFGGDKFKLYSNNFDRSAKEVADLIVQYRNANIKLHS